MASPSSQYSAKKTGHSSTPEQRRQAINTSNATRTGRVSQRWSARGSRKSIATSDITGNAATRPRNPKRRSDPIAIAPIASPTMAATAQTTSMIVRSVALT